MHNFLTDKEAMLRRLNTIFSQLCRSINKFLASNDNAKRFQADFILHENTIQVQSCNRFSNIGICHNNILFRDLLNNKEEIRSTITHLSDRLKRCASKANTEFDTIPTSHSYKECEIFNKDIFILGIFVMFTIFMYFYFLHYLQKRNNHRYLNTTSTNKNNIYEPCSTHAKLTKETDTSSYENVYQEEADQHTIESIPNTSIITKNIQLTTLLQNEVTRL